MTTQHKDKRRRVIALTGGFASGKSTVSAYFKDHGITIIDADEIAHALCEIGAPALDKIRDTFGDGVFSLDGALDRSVMRDIIFHDTRARHALERILHPLIRQEIEHQIKAHDSPYCLLVIPLLAEHYEEYRAIIDHVIVMDTPKAKQLAWAANRPDCSRELVEKILSQQASIEDRLMIADTHLKNDRDLEALKVQVQRLHQRFLELQ